MLIIHALKPHVKMEELAMRITLWIPNALEKQLVRDIQSDNDNE